MKNLLAVVLGVAFAGVSLAHTSSEEKAGERQAGQAAKVKVAVIEFTPGPNAPGMTPRPSDSFRQAWRSHLWKATDSTSWM